MDTGGAIDGTHLDFYLGFSETNPFEERADGSPFVTSAASGKFQSLVVTNNTTPAYLRSIYRA
jgi:hypothetical protein